jgi:hypothetical protein
LCGGAMPSCKSCSGRWPPRNCPTA